MSMKTFRERIDKHIEITKLENRDQEKVNRIIRSILQKGGVITPEKLRRMVCGPRTYGLPSKSKFEKIGMTPRRYYSYLRWLKDNGYVAQEKRGKPLQLTKKGQDYWKSRASLELINDVESPERMLEIIESLILLDRQRTIKKIVPIMSKSLADVAKRIDELYQYAPKMDTKELMPLIRRVDQMYREQVEELGYEVVGDWEDLRTKSAVEVEKTDKGLVLRNRKTGRIVAVVRY